MILTALCGHGHLDLAAYENYLAGKMVDYDLTDKELADAMSTRPRDGLIARLGQNSRSSSECRPRSSS